MTAALPPVLDYAASVPPAAGGAIEIAPRILWLRMPLPFALDHINLWLLADADGFTLVDCGYGDDATRSLWEQHAATTLAASPLQRIVVTHCHPDHVGNAAWLATLHRAPIAMTPAEYLTAHALAGQYAGHTPQAIVSLFAAHGMSEGDIAALERRGNAYGRGVPELPQTYQRIQGGDPITAGGTSWRVLEGYGHSPQHASLYSAERGVLIAGDMLLPKISTNVSVWPVEPDGNPLARFLHSLSIFEALPPDTLVLPSHGLPFRGIPLRVAQLRAHHDARLSELAETLSASAHPLCAADLVPVLFRRKLDVHQSFFAMGEAIAHLNHLWRAARLERRTGKDGIVRFAPSAA